MQPIQLFALASKQADWLQVRQEVVTTNIANANTPKYRAKDVAPFEAVLQNADLGMTRTNPAHFSGSDFSGSGDVPVHEEDPTSDVGVQESGNSVSLETELSKAGEIQRQYGLNTALVSSFHKMMMSVVKG